MDEWVRGLDRTCFCFIFIYLLSYLFNMYGRVAKGAIWVMASASESDSVTDCSLVAVFPSQSIGLCHIRKPCKNTRPLKPSNKKQIDRFQRKIISQSICAGKLCLIPTTFPWAVQSLGTLLAIMFLFLFQSHQSDWMQSHWFLPLCPLHHLVTDLDGEQMKCNSVVRARSLNSASCLWWGHQERWEWRSNSARVVDSLVGVFLRI